jgi:glycosyltransferase involved in cell wall biosynthesis
MGLPAMVVMFVLNDCRYDTRVLREAATLAGAGYQVTIVARTVEPYAAAGEREVRPDGVVIVRVPVAAGLRRWFLLARWPHRLVAAAGQWVKARARQGPQGWGVILGAAIGALLAAPFVALGVAVAALARRATTLLPPLGAVWAEVSWRLQWRLSVLSWARAAAAAAPPPAVVHAHDLRALPAAMLSRRAGTVFIYDSHELYAEAGANALRSTASRRAMGQLERRWSAGLDALVTVNEELAMRLREAIQPPRVVVVHNCPPLWQSPQPPPDRLREATGLPRGTPLILYHGALVPGRGLAELAAAMPEPGLEGAHLVVMGWGPLESEVAALAAAPAPGGRLHLLPPVPPDELLPWVASADVVAVPIQPDTLNHRLSTPNKLWEAIAAGVPVVASDFPAMRRIVLDDPAGPLGAVCDPTDPRALAAALAGLLAQPPAERDALRARCHQAATERWNWETEGGKLLALYGALTGGARLTEGPVTQRATFVLPGSGGHDSRTRRLAAGLSGRGHVVTVIARREADPAAEEPWPPGVLVRRVAVDGSRGGDGPSVPAGAGLGRWLGEARRIAAIARRAGRQARAAQVLDEGADLYQAMGFLALPVGLRLAARARAPLVYDARDVYAESNNVARLPWAARVVFRWRERTWARRADRVFTVNDECAAYLRQSLGVPRPAVVMNAQVVGELPTPPPDHLRRALGLPASTPLAMYHGGFMPDRGLVETVLAWRRPELTAVHLVLMGSGALRATLADLAAAPAAGGRVHLLPAVPPDELLAWVAEADVGLMLNQPRTLNERLSTPNKLFECLAVGTPVVSSDFPARRHIIIDDPDGPLGAVCDPTDPAAIAAAVRSILDQAPADRARLRARIRGAAAARYAWEDQFAVVLREYRQLTGRPW